MATAHTKGGMTRYAAAWWGFILFLALQSEVVAGDAAGVDCAGFAQGGVIFLEALELAGFVERDRVLIVVLDVGERLFAFFFCIETGDCDPMREWRLGFDLMRDFGRVGGHHQIPADECERREVAACRVTHTGSYTPVADKKSWCAAAEEGGHGGPPH